MMMVVVSKMLIFDCLLVVQAQFDTVMLVYLVRTWAVFMLYLRRLLIPAWEHIHKLRKTKSHHEIIISTGLDHY